MGVALSSVVLALVFIWIVIAERKCARRSREFFARADSVVQALTETTQKRYRDRFGKDPTGGFPLMKTKGPPRTWYSVFTRRK